MREPISELRNNQNSMPNTIKGTGLICCVFARIEHYIICQL